MRTTAQIVRGYRGPALFSFGFRPFFLLAAAFAALAIPLWIIAALWAADAAPAVTRDWHAHEMLFGYAAAVITGYMIIAGANWTGHYPVAGVPVMLLAGLWLAGRAAMLLLTPASPVAMGIDGLFLPLFAAALWREQMAARNGRNMVPCLIVTLLAAANIAFHLRVAWPSLGPMSTRLALALVVLLIIVMGGRLIPSFTRNWLARRGMPDPAPYDRFDLLASILSAGALALWIAAPAASATAAMLCLAGGGVLLRLARWRGWVAWREPLVWALHLGYLWLAIGLILLGAAIAFPARVPASGAIHALTAGAIGTMTLAMMTRTTLSHTGRARQGGGAARASFLSITAAAALRVAAAFVPAAGVGLMTASALLWSAAFLSFLIVYGPMLASRRAPPGA